MPRASPPDEIARSLAVTPTRLEIAMLGDRPVYRFAAEGRSATVFADDGARLQALGDDEVMRLARALFPEHAATARQGRRLESPDQWTLQNRDALPLHRIVLGDDQDTWVYLSERTGELVMAATRSERRRAYASAVPHWLYVTPLRRHGLLWGRLVIGLSLAGCVLAASGLIWGVLQLTRRRSLFRCAPRFALRRSHALAPLRGPGLRPVHLHLGGERLPVDGSLELALLHRATTEQAAAVAGAPMSIETLTLDRLRAALASLAASSPAKVKTLELVQFRSEPYLVAYGAPDEATHHLAHGLVSVLHPDRGPSSTSPKTTSPPPPRAAMPAARLVDAALLQRPDAYYYDLYGPAPLPVLRARFDDAARTWIYLDPATGTIARKEDASSRLNRWIYHGLHSFDFPFLLSRPALRNAIVVILSLGGLLVALTSMTDGWRRVVRHVRRLR